MASRNKLLITAAVTMLVVVVLPATAFPPTIHQIYWGLGVDYDRWSYFNSPVNAGDGLEFNCDDPTQHSVVMVDKGSYDTCTVPNNAPTWGCGLGDIVQLPEAGQYYFICGMGDHCSRGMNLAIIAL